MRFVSQRLLRLVDVYVSAFALCLASAVAPAQDLKRDIPSIARDARRCVVTIETKDALGRSLSLGSGFLVSNEGRVVTNHHVIEGAASGTIRFADGASYLIEGFLASDPERDLVLLKIKTTSSEFRFLSLGDSDRVEIGEQVVAVGSPLGLEETVSPGFISGVREVNGLKLLQTTAPISPGNSGGALINLSGEVVGVPTLSLTRVDERATVSQNINFAVPSNYVRDLIGAATKEANSLPAAVAPPKSKQTDRLPSEMIASAKTLCVWVVSGSAVLKTELSGKLSEWGRLRLVSSPADADLVLKVAQTGELNLATGAGNQATALLTDRQSGTELWSKTKGGSWAMTGYSNAWVARALAKEFIKFYDSATKKSHK